MWYTSFALILTDSLYADWVPNIPTDQYSVLAAVADGMGSWEPSAFAPDFAHWPASNILSRPYL